MPSRILVVDDDPCIRTFVRCILEAAGYTVSCAGCAREALRKAREVTFDMLLSDILMPDGDGIQLAFSLTALQPGMRIILMTGFANGLFELEPRWKVIGKPFRPAQLIAMVAANLNSQFGHDEGRQSTN